MSQATTDLSPAMETAEPSFFSDFMVLTKARLSLMVIITTFVGFCMGAGASFHWVLLLHAVFGTTLAAASAAVFNQYLEIEHDRRMERTRHRPLPAGRIKPSHALLMGIAMGLAGVAWLVWFVNLPSAILAASTIFIYAAIYTPMKRMTAYCTVVGAISGALPPVIGWVAAQPSFGIGAWVLFGILFTWQMPHFLAIAWMYRDEYSQAGFVMLQRSDITGARTAMESLIYTIALTIITLVPYHTGMNSDIYLGGAMLLDGIMFLFAVQFLVERERVSARRLFLASILFLPLILGLMIFTKA